MKSNFMVLRKVFFFSFLLTFLLFGFIGCYKTASINNELIAKDAREEFYKNSEQLNKSLTGLVNSFKKQAMFDNQLALFIKKNGLPVWDKTIYSLGGGPIQTNGSVKTDAISQHISGSEPVDTSKGLFLIPLKSSTTGNIQSYITAYKHNDSNYTYRLYNKDSLDRIHPLNDSAKAALRTTEAIFGVFEKSINNKDSITITGGKIKNAAIQFGRTSQTNVSKKANEYKSNDIYCLVDITITITYQWIDFSYLYGNQWFPVSVTIDINIFCWGSGSSGGGGTGGGGINSGTWGGTSNDPYNNWWLYGTGWPWNNPGVFGNSDPWNYWWTSGGVGGGGNFYDFRTTSDYDTGDEDNNSSGGYDNTSYSDYDSNVPNWPIIKSVLPVSDFIGWGSPGISRNCMSYAKAQIAKKGYSISNYSDPGQTIQIFTAANGVNVNQSKNGVGYLLSALQRGIPIIVGVDDQPGSPNPGTDNTTDHFIVIVGTGADSNGNYFTFFDNASGNIFQGTNPNNKLYYDSITGKISGKSQTDYALGLNDYVVTMIRKSK